MKYIKIYEEFEDSYFEIDEEEYKFRLNGMEKGRNILDYNIVSLLNSIGKARESWLDFTSKEKRILRKKFDVINKYKKDSKSISIRVEDGVADLSKLPDEWYYVHLCVNKSDTYYKCDQWEGLMDCLNDIIQ